MKKTLAWPEVLFEWKGTDSPAWEHESQRTPAGRVLVDGRFMDVCLLLDDTPITEIQNSPNVGTVLLRSKTSHEWTDITGMDERAVNDAWVTLQMYDWEWCQKAVGLRLYSFGVPTGVTVVEVRYEGKPNGWAWLVDREPANPKMTYGDVEFACLEARDGYYRIRAKALSVLPDRP